MLRIFILFLERRPWLVDEERNLALLEYGGAFARSLRHN